MTRSLRELRTGSAVLCLLSTLTTVVFVPHAVAQSTASVGFYRGNANRTGFVSGSLTTPLSVAWQNTSAPAQRCTSTPVADNGVLFYATGPTIYAVSMDDGAVKWQYPAAGSTNDPDVRKPGTFLGEPCVADGKVFIGNDDGYLYAIDEQSGEDVFQVHTDGPIRTSPSVDNGVVYFGSVDGKLYDIREDNQQTAWGGNFRTQGPLLGCPIVTDDQVIFADTNNVIYDAAKSTGRILWSSTIQNGIVESDPMIADGNIVVASDKYLIALSKRNGMQVWQAPLPTVISNQPATNADGTIFYVITGDAFLNAVNSRGHIFWRTHLDSPASSGPSVVGNSIVLALKSGSVYVFDTTTGAVDWSYNIHSITPPTGNVQHSDGAISAEPLVIDGQVFVLSNDSTLTALTAKSADQVAPVATLLYPTENQAVAGSQISYTINLIDAGSGVQPSTIVLKVDGKIVPTEYSVASQLVQVKLISTGQLFGSTPVNLATLTSGQHILTLTAADWRGNILNKTWRFTVDPKLNPANAPLPPTSNSGLYATQSGTSSEFGGGDGTTNDSGVAPAAAGAGASGGNGGGGSPSGQSGPGISSSSGSVNGGSGGTPAPSTPIPTPILPPPGTGGGGGAGGFPPPPPI